MYHDVVMYKVHAIKSSHLYYFVLFHIHYNTQPLMAVCLQDRHVCPGLMLSHMINAKKNTLSVLGFKKTSVCLSGHECAMVPVWMSEDDLWELVLSFCHVDPKDEAQVFKLSGSVNLPSHRDGF